MRSFFSIFIFLMILTGCLQTENSSSQDRSFYAVPVTGTPEFLAARNVFQQHCSVACHMPAGFHPYAYMSEEQLLDTPGNLVVAQNLAQSRIYSKIRGATVPGDQNMPPDHDLTAEDIQTVADWINSITP